MHLASGVARRSSSIEDKYIVHLFQNVNARMFWFYPKSYSYDSKFDQVYERCTSSEHVTPLYQNKEFIALEKTISSGI